MDGSLASKRFQGRHIQPVSTHFATTALPQWVYGMFTYNIGKPAVTVDHQSNSLGHKIVLLSRGTGVGPLARIWLLEDDYLLIKQIVETLQVPLFPQESQQSIMKRITGALSVSFAGRGAFDK
jgi:hypothetical protein